MACLIAAPKGWSAYAGHPPGMSRLWTAAIDSHLNEQAFIVPGLATAGNRAYGTA
jgi:uracil phosphoribosyltransferase